jgi:hypothetical protein
VRESLVFGAHNPIYPEISGCRNERYHFWEKGGLDVVANVHLPAFPLSGNLDISSWE